MLKKLYQQIKNKKNSKILASVNHKKMNSSPSFAEKATDRHIQIFIIIDSDYFLGSLSKFKFEALFSLPFEQLRPAIIDYPIFLKVEDAFCFTEKNSHRQHIIDAYVPDNTIEGRFIELKIDPNKITEKNIKGLYFRTNGSWIYENNKNFNQNLYNITIENQEEAQELS